MVQFIGLFSLVIVFYLIALVFAKGIRFQDILGTITLARLPYFFISLLGLLVNKELVDEMDVLLVEGNLSELSQAFSSAASIIIVALLMVPFVIWFIALLYNAFRVSTGLKGVRCVALFILGVLVAEILSIVVLIGLS